jgi:hypothetical protein
LASCGLYTVDRAHHALRADLWERLVLPVRAEDKSLRLVVFNKPREYLDDLLQAVLGASPEAILGLRCVRNDCGEMEDAIVIIANERAAGESRRVSEQVLTGSLAAARTRQKNAAKTRQ